MDLDALGNIGDFVGGVAVIATLFYLAVQIRQNTRQVTQSVELARAATIKGATTIGPTLLGIAQDPELARILYAGLADYSALAGEERMRFTMVLGALVSPMAQHTLEIDALGFDGDRRFADQTVALGNFLLTPGGREWWTRNSAQYPPAFQDFVAAEVLVPPNGKSAA